MDFDPDSELRQTLELARQVLARLTALASSGSAAGAFALRLARAHALALMDELNELAAETDAPLAVASSPPPAAASPPARPRAPSARRG